ncbi:hypothetical protein SODALDRAFT_355670 [Sodiomyces alkalinus F11]|uniref:Uncharacterized protein n=1 Tax=Sodiomyces alkalinus (strain CBS 110278 / VKM F-3762 / F11) TaxID=1314773 RepID=A0A3N2Q9Y9_SODAK|nr:hypothetical protein SODALDRAFT_355670 [Sodiomyces alkalinus F11]ROT43465.1 hypothetical protein SODALDRAFT_355670 [Sodiomyces alkalinus F11]
MAICSYFFTLGQDGSHKATGLTGRALPGLLLNINRPPPVSNALGGQVAFLKFLQPSLAPPVAPANRSIPVSQRPVVREKEYNVKGAALVASFLEEQQRIAGKTHPPFHPAFTKPQFPSGLWSSTRREGNF